MVKIGDDTEGAFMSTTKYFGYPKPKIFINILIILAESSVFVENLYGRLF